MRWPIPKLGDTRWFRWFAILPIDTDDAGRVWLEWVWIEAVYTTHATYVSGVGPVESGPAWLPGKALKTRTQEGTCDG